jgi:hypothetical protein
MALVKCVDCGNQISDRAPACPTCGAPLVFPSGGDFDFSCDVPTVTMRRKTQTLSYTFPDGFQGKMKFVIEGGMSPKLVALEIGD